jgi:Protein of unknown function (DUF3999)
MNCALKALFALVAAPCLLVLAEGEPTGPRPASFRHERAILPGGPGPNRLALDAAVLAGGSRFFVSRVGGREAAGEAAYVAEQGLGDLRIYDASGREVPYLLISPPSREPRWIMGRLIPVAATRKTSGFELDLGETADVDRMQIAHLPSPFLKRVQLEGSGDRVRWTLLVAEGTLFDLPEENLRRLELEFQPGRYRYLRLTWDDRTSGRVPMPASAVARTVDVSPAPPPLRIDVPFERRGSEPGVSRYRLRLPGLCLPITAIELSCGGGDILRNAHVTEAQLSGAEVVPVQLGSRILRRALRGDLAAAELQIPILTPTEAELELVVIDENNPPLDLRGVSAVFAQLPWIYFESQDAGQLTARFGRPDLRAPQYDLEARRESVLKSRSAEARWGEVVKPRAEAEAGDGRSMPVAGAAIDAGDFRYSRPLPGSRRGLTAVTLDVAVLAHSDLSDLRISRSDGRQVPYLLEKVEEPLTIELPTLEAANPPGQLAERRQGFAGARSFYRLRLPYEGLPASRLVLQTRARVFQRRVGILIEKDLRDPRREAWSATVAEAGWRHGDPETPAPPLVLQLPPLKTVEALIVVEEGDNAALPLGPPKLLLPGYRLRFFREDEWNLSLLYGNHGLSAPKYDLALLAPRLVGAAALEITPGPESASTAETWAMPRRIFWLVLALATAALLALIVRLVRKNEAPPR